MTEPKIVVEDFPAEARSNATNGWAPNVGERVRALDRDNVGEVLEVDLDAQRAKVRFVAPDDGAVAIVGLRFDKLAPLEGSTSTARATPPEPVQLLTVAEVLAIPSPGWLVDGLLPADAVACLYGPPGAGKSFVVLDMLLAIARGAAWHGIETQRRPVVYACGEGGHSLSLRLRAWCKGYCVNAAELEREAAPILVALQVPQLGDRASVDLFANAILDRLEREPREADRPAPKAGLIVIDTLSRALVGRDENSAEHMSIAVAHADRLRRATGASVLLVHHTGKDGSKGERGSSVLRGAVDTLLELKSTECGIEIRVGKQKDGRPAWPIHLKLEEIQVGNDPKGRAVTSCLVRSPTKAEVLVELSGASREILDLLTRPEHADGLPQSEIRALLDDMGKSTFFKVIKSLLAEKAVAKRRGKYFACPPSPAAVPAAGATETGAK